MNIVPTDVLSQNGLQKKGSYTEDLRLCCIVEASDEEVAGDEVDEPDDGRPGAES